MAGRLIVLEGTDGAGKSTQTELLVKRLRAEGQQAVDYHFPRYGEPSAYFVEKYLRGEYPMDQTGPYQTSVFYALDRYEAAAQIRQDLASDAVVISDRYTSSSMAHLGGKITSKEGREQFFGWLSDLEYEKLNIPRPSKSFILHMPADKAQKQLNQRQPKDIHEKDLSHLLNAEKTYLELCLFEPDMYQLIECSDGDSITSIDEIHELIWAAVSQVLASPA